jgi:hypothetical protein
VLASPVDAQLAPPLKAPAEDLPPSVIVGARKPVAIDRDRLELAGPSIPSIPKADDLTLVSSKVPQ